jgi:predicted metal-dependent hydrolase
MAEKKISYELKISKRAKRLRLAVYGDGRVVLTSPYGVKRSVIEMFVENQKQWIFDKVDFYNKAAENQPIRRYTYKDYLANKHKAYLLARERLAFYNDIYGFSYNRIFIKNQKTVWGSCSSDRNLNFNFKIAFLPEKHRDYIIVHELCHLKEMNHSKNFWSLVEKTFPDHLKIRKDLRARNLFNR